MFRLNKLIPVIQMYVVFTGIEARAEWICEPGQPDACINEVKGYMANQLYWVQFFQSQIDNGPRQMAECRTEKLAARSAHESAVRSASTARGSLEELRSQREALRRTERLIQNQLLVAQSFNRDFQSYVRDIIVALNSDIHADSMSEIRELQTSLSDELARSTSESKKQILRMVIAMTDEVIAAGRNSSSRNSTLLDRLTAELASNSDRLSTFTRAAIEGALNDKDFAEMNLSEKISVLTIQANSNLREIQKQKLEVESKIASKKSLLEYFETITDQKLNLEESISQYCDDLQKRINEAPNNRNAWQSKWNQNNEYLNHDRCRADHCRYERHGGASDRF